MSFGVGHRHGSDPALLWLWCRPVATALIQPLAWEHPYAMETAQEMVKRPKKYKLTCTQNKNNTHRQKTNLWLPKGKVGRENIGV